MRLKLLLFLLFVSGALYAQEPYRNLIFSEMRQDDPRFAYIELTNMGNKTVNLAEFEIGNNDPWTSPWNAPATRRYRLPEKMLAPGESYLIVSVDDVPIRIWQFDPERYLGSRTITNELRSLADLEIHFPTSEWGQWADYDSVSPYGQLTMDNWGGRSAIFLRHFFLETELERDSAIVDVYNANFDSETSPYKSTGAVNAAGVTGATGNRILVRKHTVTEGTGDAIDSWSRVAGIDITDSEWLPLRFPADGWNVSVKKEYWTLGNHGNFVLDNNSVHGKTAATVVDFDNKTITVPWGVRGGADFMNNFEYSPGLAWFYSLSAEKEDSAFVSARTNDTISLYAVGNNLQEIKFRIITLPSTNADNLVIPKVPINTGSARYRGTYEGMGAYCGITTGNVVDTIKAANMVLGIGYATRADSLLKYLEKPDQASWEIVYVDGVERADLKTGDKLKVTAGNGAAKEYYILCNRYVPGKNARLSAITWPDIPESLKGIFGWVGDTIPGFSASNYDYVINIPAETVGVPALLPKAEELNTTIEVVRALNLAGSLADRTAIFNTTAQDGTTKLSYKVTMNKEKDPDQLQPNFADPFISEFVWQDQWANQYMEVVNPGNQILDLSNYMFSFGYVNDPASAITRLADPESWANRYGKYIPGYKWIDQATWETQPAMVVPDPAVNPILYPGEVFVLGDTRSTGNSDPYPWWGGNKAHIDFGRNPWDEPVENWTSLQQWSGGNWFLFRIDNDSITAGEKAATDPNDFTLIDVFGMGDGSTLTVGGTVIEQIISYTRKPEIYKGNTEFMGSFGTDAESSEWTYTNRAYWVNKGYGWPQDILMVCSGLGSHFMNEVTAYKSTVNSVAYKVSEGYSMEETIRGVRTNTPVEEFLTRIIKADPDQSLTLKKAGTGETLADAAILEDGDVLFVLSADSTNTSAYILNVTPGGLSTNAILTSATYFISVDITTGGIYLIPPGTKLNDALANVTVPEGASLTVIDHNSAWVPHQRMNFDTTMVDVIVSDHVFFEVVAEDGVTKVTYQLIPDSDPGDAYVLSDVYLVEQDALLIEFVPRGTEVSTFLNNLIPVAGATLKVVDKNGLQRTSGSLFQDDMLVVTSKDGKVTKTYYLDMLRTQFVTTQYLAYVLSDTYQVDQLEKSIAKPMAESSVDQFLAKLTPAFGATMELLDKDGVAKSTGKLMRGDVLKVTSADKKITALYTLDLDYTIAGQIRNEISVYPNPTSGQVNISGIEAGNHIRVISLSGAVLIDKTAASSLEVISLGNQPAGMYFITVTNADRMVGQYKVIRK